MNPPTTYVAPEILAASLEGAGHGASFFYAAGPCLDPENPTVQLAARWMQAGKARTNIAGRDLNGRLQYQITRLIKPAAEAKSALRPRRADAVPAPLLPLYQLLVQLEADGLPCPSDAALAKRLGLSDRHAASYQLQRLAALGFIQKSNPRHGQRVVSIL